MNNLLEALAIHSKIATLMNLKRSLITFEFFNGTKLTATVKEGNAKFGVNKPSITVDTFTSDINKITTYDLFEVKDVY